MRERIEVNSLEDLAKLFEELFPNHDFRWREMNGYWMGLCPFHDDHTPSFSIREGNDGNFYFKCFGCGKQGGVGTVVQMMKEMGLIEEDYEEEKKARQKRRTNRQVGKASQKTTSTIGSINEKEGKIKSLNQQNDGKNEKNEEAELGLEFGEKFIESATIQMAEVVEDFGNIFEQFKGLIEDRFIFKNFLDSGSNASTQEKLQASLVLLADKIKLFRDNWSFAEDDGKARLLNAISYFNLGIITPAVINKLKDKYRDFYYFLERKYRISEKIGWLVFPYYTLKGELAGFKFRNIAESSRSSRDFKFLKKPSYFGGRKAIKDYMTDKNNILPLFIVEGETDALAVFCDTFNPVIAIGSVSNISNLLVDSFPELTFMLYFPDYDPFTLKDWGAGREAVRKLYRERADRYRKSKNSWRKIFVYCDEVGYGDGKDICDGIYKLPVKHLLSSSKILELKDAVIEIKRQHERFRQTWVAEERQKLREIGLEGLAQALSSFVQVSNIVPVRGRDIKTIDKKHKQPLLGVYPPNKVSLIAGMGGTGKTTYTFYLADRIITEMGDAKKVLIWSTEHSIEEMKEVNDIIVKNRFEEFEEAINSQIYYIDHSPQPALNQKTGQFNEDFFSDLEYLLRSYDVVFLDPLISFLGVDENQAHLIRPFFDKVHEILSRLEKEGLVRYLIILLHTNKLGGDEFRIYISDYEDTKTTTSDGRVEFHLRDMEKTRRLMRLIRGSSAIYDAARYIELLLFSTTKTDKRKQQQQDIEIRNERIVLTVKANYPSARRLGYGEIIPDLLSPKEERKEIPETTLPEEAEKIEQQEETEVDNPIGDEFDF